MLTAVSNAKSYDWATWLIGLMRSFLSGGSVALMTYGGASILKLPFKQTLLLMGINFFGMGIYRLGEFMQLHGAPEQVQATLATAAAASQETSDAIARAQSQAPEAKK